MGEENREEWLREHGMATELLPIEASLTDFLAAIVKDDLYYQGERGFRREPSKIVSNEEVNDLLHQAKILVEHIWIVQDRIRRTLCEAISRASEREAKKIYRMVYWGHRLTVFGDDEEWSVIDYELFLGLGCPEHKGVPRTEEEWQEVAGPLEYTCHCVVCGKRFRQLFTSCQQYEVEYTKFPGDYGHIADICPHCQEGLPRTSGYVYLLQSPTKYYKIGRTKDPKDRIQTFGVKLPFEVEYICVVKTFDMYRLEKKLHEQFEDKRAKGEWFALDKEDVEYIKGLAEASRHLRFLEE